MMGGRRRTIAALTLLLALAACAGASTPAPGVAVGQTAPDLALPDLEGRRVSLSDFRGQVVLVNLWATWCPPCRAEIPVLEAAYRVHRDQGLVVLGVNVEESRAVVIDFVAEMGITYPVLLDALPVAPARLRVLGLPTTLLLDRDGVVRVRHQGEISEQQLGAYLREWLAP